MISIHTSLTGSDGHSYEDLQSYIISIHTSLTGSDEQEQQGKRLEVLISIHTSLTGSDSIFAQIKLRFFMQNTQYFFV